MLQSHHYSFSYKFLAFQSFLIIVYHITLLLSSKKCKKFQKDYKLITKCN
nr:MAG TPA: hypothetical protein [Bacteriophage sp.]